MPDDPPVTTPDTPRPNLMLSKHIKVVAHIMLDFLTDLLESEGQTTILILVITDRFSRVIKLVTHSTLSSALETAEGLFYIFRCYYIPEDTVNDRGLPDHLFMIS